ncbi:MAG: rhodanese-like domain-containing protein [Myxococcota bacterium]
MSLWKWLFGGNDSASAQKIGADRARELVAQGATLVDVRSLQEFRGGHLDGALHVPVDQIAQRMGEIPHGPVVLYCRSGMRSARAGRALIAAGREAVFDLGPMSAF